MSDTQADPVPAQPKRWPVALLVALITGIASAFISVPISDWAMTALKVSNFEGGRAMGVVCIWAPLAAIVGMVVGFVVSFQIKRPGFAGFALRQGLALAIMVLLIGGVGGLAYATADHPPLIDGKTLALDIEVRVPAKGRSIEDLKTQKFDVAVVVSASDRSYSDLRWSEATQTDEFITVPAWGTLNSSNAGREITAGVEGENRQLFSVMLGAKPTKLDQWSEWTPPRQRFDGSKPAPNDQYLVRYRVRFDSLYSPTPQPYLQEAPVPQEMSTPEELPTPEASVAE
jgi:hypothetical protein